MAFCHTERSTLLAKICSSGDGEQESQENGVRANDYPKRS